MVKMILILFCVKTRYIFFSHLSLVQNRAHAHHSIGFCFFMFYQNK